MNFEGVSSPAMHTSDELANSIDERRATPKLFSHSGSLPCLANPCGKASECLADATRERCGQTDGNGVAYLAGNPDLGSTPQEVVGEVL